MNKLENVLSKAQELMLNEEFNQKVEGIAANYGGGSNRANTQDLSSFEQMAFGSSYSNDNTNQQYNNTNRLPQSIRESFEKTPPLTGQDVSQMGLIEKKLSLRNQNNNVYQAPQSSLNNGIDYSLIKTIIDESISRNLSQNKLNENVIRGMKISNGNKIQVIDSKGNLYEGILKLKKKA